MLHVALRYVFSAFVARKINNNISFHSIQVLLIDAYFVLIQVLIPKILRMEKNIDYVLVFTRIVSSLSVSLPRPSV